MIGSQNLSSKCLNYPFKAVSQRANGAKCSAIGYSEIGEIFLTTFVN